MQNFSDMHNLDERGTLIKKVSLESGLSKDRVEKLYESFRIQSNNDFKKINESFIEFLQPKKLNLDNFKNKIYNITKTIATGKLSLDERASITDQLITMINEYCGVYIDMPLLLEIVSFVLLEKNPDNFKKVSDEIHFGQKSHDLFESELKNGSLQQDNLMYKLDFSDINVSPKNNIDKNKVNLKEDKRLYESLKEILGKNNYRFGGNNHIDNSYQTILNYLDDEILSLTTKDTIYTLDDSFEMELINMLVKSNQLDPMYKHGSVLKELIPDMQTLVFDMMVLVQRYFDDNQKLLQFINRSAHNDYILATKGLFAKISSSVKTSKIIVHQDDNIDVEKVVDQSDFYQIFSNLRVDDYKLDLHIYPLRPVTTSECLQIVKSVESEFNLSIRNSINFYFTKAMNLVASTEKFYYESGKINKFKNNC